MMKFFFPEKSDASEETLQKLCPYEFLMNDGICDDKSNTYQCDFDGGDCCRKDSIMDLCLQCQCFSKYSFEFFIVFIQIFKPFVERSNQKFTTHFDVQL